MQKIFFSILILSFLIVGTGVLAKNDELSSPGITPDSPFYFLEIITEEIGTFFTFGDIKKAERHAALAAERLAEAKAMVEKGKPEFVEKTMERYENQLNNCMARVAKAQVKEQSAEKVTAVLDRVGQATSKHLEVLAEVYEKVPEEAKPAIENAMKASVKGHEKAVEALKAQNALGEVPEAVSLPMVVPQEVRERVQRGAQEELMAEKFLQGSESPRELCIKSGGPQEMCEKIPLDGFESFEALKAFFIEAEGPSEQWAIAESKCKESGATTPDKCFRLLLISSVTTYATTALSAVPRERDPDCPFGHVTYGQEKSCCVDSDGSFASNPIQHDNDHYRKGTLECKVINTADGTLISHTIETDSCEGDKLIERKHDNYSKASFEEYNCPNGCQDGACIREATKEVSEEGVSSNLGGIGAGIGIKNGQLIIVRLLEDSPAERAGLRTGDKILAINGEDTAGVAIIDAIKKIRGEIGTKVVLTISRNDEEGIKNISIIRAHIE